MKHLPIAIALAMLAGLAGTPAHAETIFRCGHEYSGVACPNARTLVVANAVTVGQRAEARDVARREKALAAEMTRDRREQEALLKPALAGSLSAPRVTAPAPMRSPRSTRRRPGRTLRSTPSATSSPQFQK